MLSLRITEHLALLIAIFDWVDLLSLCGLLCAFRCLDIWFSCSVARSSAGLPSRGFLLRRVKESFEPFFCVKFVEAPLKFGLKAVASCFCCFFFTSSTDFQIPAIRLRA